MVTLGVIVGVAVRIEHRLTKIETDISWLKQNNKCAYLGGEHDDCDQEVDKS
jgi:hypothetical protein